MMINNNNKSKKLGLGGLIALVFGSIIGGGIFNIAQNMAGEAALIGVVLSWIISATGVLFLVLMFKVLADTRPDLNAGIYQFAKVGFGNYVGFNIAWGYWICAAIGNIAFAVMLNDSFGEFFPVLLKHGWPTVVFGSSFIWIMFFIVSRGIKSAAALNTIVSIVKFGALFFIIIMLIISFRLKIFTYDIWGKVDHLGSLVDQIKSTMLITIWCFMGVEGAIVMAARAKNSKDVGKAGIIGFLLAFMLYAMISVLSFGVLKQHQLSMLDDPSVAYIVKDSIGEWAYTFVIISVITAVLGGWIAWTIICAQVPYTAAQVKILPKSFLKENKKQSPVYALFISTIIMQFFMIVVITAKSVYMAAVDLTGIMIIPAYLFCGLYFMKISFSKNAAKTFPKNKILKYRILSTLATAFCLWLLYSGGLLLFFITSICYISGIYFFIIARKENRAEEIGRAHV